MRNSRRQDTLLSLGLQKIPGPQKEQACLYQYARRPRFFVLSVMFALLLGLTFVFSPTNSAWAMQAAPQVSLASQVDNLFRGLVARQGFSGSVLVAKNGQIILEKGYSMANWNRGIPNTPDTRFYLGSVTKEFTSMGILILQERGKLQVHNHVCTYIPHCPTPWKSVTLHEMLTHTSGIPQLDAFRLSMSSPAAWISSFDHVPLEFQPGSRFHYCNICYQILAYVVQRVSGMPYTQFLKQNIFSPLQLTSTSFDSNYYYSHSNDAIGYASWRSPAMHLGWPASSQWSFLNGSGLLYSTVKDLYRWDQALYTTKLVSQQTLNEAFTPYVTANLFANSKYGYGWFISPSPIAGHPLIWHDGVIQGFRTYIGRYIKDHITIIFLSNLATIAPVPLAHSVEHLVFSH